MTITKLITIFVLKELEAKKRDYKDLQKEAAFFKSQILMRDELIEVRYEYPFGAFGTITCLLNFLDIILKFMYSILFVSQNSEWVQVPVEYFCKI